MTASRWLTETREAIQPDHDESLASTDIVQEPREHRPIAVGTGGMLLEHDDAACGAQLIELGIGALVFGGNARIADQTA